MRAEDEVNSRPTLYSIVRSASSAGRTRGRCKPSASLDGSANSYSRQAKARVQNHPHHHRHNSGRCAVREKGRVKRACFFYCRCLFTISRRHEEERQLPEDAPVSFSSGALHRRDQLSPGVER